MHLQRLVPRELAQPALATGAGQALDEVRMFTSADVSLKAGVQPIGK